MDFSVRVGRGECLAPIRRVDFKAICFGKATRSV